MPEEIKNKIFKSILEGEFDNSINYKKIDRDFVLSIISDALEEVGRLFEEGTYFIPEMMASGDVSKNILEEISQAENSADREPGIVIGSVYGDQHEIGKNIIKSILQAEGFAVLDLGSNVGFEEFKKSLYKTKSKILLLSCLTSASTSSLAKIVKRIREDKDLEDIIIIIGGLASDSCLADDTGADSYCAGPKDLLVYIKSLK